MDQFNFIEAGYRIGVYFIPFLFAICFHEFAHGWVAKKRGDRTAEIMGRLTLNPIAHIDVIGTLVLPLMAIFLSVPFFGWAKPVPVNSRNLKKPREDMFWIAFAGPLSNVLLAVLGSLAFALTLIVLSNVPAREPIQDMVKNFVVINLFLAVFNMIPLYPLDGSQVLGRFLPHKINMWLEDNQSTTSIVLMILFLVGGFNYLALPVYWAAEWMLKTTSLLTLSLT